MADRMLISNGNPMETIVGFSRAVRVGPFIAVGGTAPVDAEGRTVGIGDVTPRPASASRSSRPRWNRLDRASATSCAHV
jgi:hypothetical protein